MQERERIEISLRVLAREIAQCRDNPRKCDLLVADFRTKLGCLPADSYYRDLTVALHEYGEKEIKMDTTGTVLVVTIRDDEIRSILDAFPGVDAPGVTQSSAPKFDDAETWYAGQFTYSGSLRTNTVRMVIVQQNETGQTDAAATTTHYIHRTKDVLGVKPDYAVLVGICAGSRTRGDSIAFGDVVVPPDILSDAVYKVSRQNGVVATFPELRSPGKPNRYLVRLSKGISQELGSPWAAHIHERVEGHKFPPGVLADPLMSGNVFVEDPEYMQKCQELYNRKIAAYEMEAGGFANACHSENLPFLVVRGMSDWADEEASNDAWRAYAGRTASALAYELVKRAHIPIGE